MAGLRFGTDGVRGRAFDELSTELAHQIGHAAARVLEGASAVIGHDGRESGPALRDALADGLRAGGVRPLDLGIVPTPAVAHVAASQAAIGVMISASHNPWHDNGIKLFTASGSKLSDAEQASIEALLDAPNGLAVPRADAPDHTPIASVQAAAGDWVRAISSTIEGDLSGLSVVVDAANGAASHLVGPALVDLGVEVELISAAPDGRNINDGCGSTHPIPLGDAVRAAGADLGIALDGDADRLVCVDHRGEVVDGDKLMAIIACDLRDRRQLRDDTVVVTVMSNLGFHRAMADAGIDVHVTPVGDRHVLEALTEGGWSFGGEQSGHLIFGELATTGDGLLSAIQVLRVVRDARRSLADLADNAMTAFPQVLRNVAVAERVADPVGELTAAIASAEDRLGTDGRVLIRASGTEPVIRVMVEAADEMVAHDVCGVLCDAVAERFGA